MIRNFKSSFLFCIQLLFSIIPQIGYKLIFQNGHPSSTSLFAFFILTILNLSLSIIFYKTITKNPLSLKNWNFLELSKNMLLGLLVIFITSIIFVVVIVVGTITSSGITSQTVNNATYDLPNWLLLIFIVISAPILEELAFRGFLIGFLFKNNEKTGCVISVLLYTIMKQPSTLKLFITVLGFTIALTLIYYRSKKIEYSIVFHMLVSTLTFLQLF